MTKPSVRAEVITRRTYNRPLNAEGTKFETWAMTINRVIEHQVWLWERAKGSSLTEEQLSELEELRVLMLARKVSMSGRTLWLGGTEISKRRESSMFNPLPIDTSFITKKGVMTFADVKEGDNLDVLTHLGNWKPAEANYAGVRDMVEISLQRINSNTTISSCLDHTWILTGGVKVLARNLKVGDRIHSAPGDSFNDFDFDSAGVDEKFWWCYGFVYGDGSVNNLNTTTENSMVRLCGDKAKYLDRFKACGFSHSFPPSCNKDPYVYTGKYLKTLPSDESNRGSIKAFLNGYLAADGHKTVQRGTTRYNNIVTTSKESADFLCKWMPTFGSYVLSCKSKERITNFGVFKGYEISFTSFGHSNGHVWVVKSLTPAPSVPCYCLTVEDDHSFVLSNGVVTGNCSFLNVETVYDMVDALWLLLQGCGVGFKPITGTLNGFMQPIPTIEVVRSTRTAKGGREFNHESFDKETGVWCISVGDSAEAWARSVGKLLAGKYPATKLVLSFAEVRPAGDRLAGYGWISSGDAAIAKAYQAIVAIMNKRAGSLLTAIDILDIVNWLGTVLSSRRSAEIALMDADDPEWKEFAIAKKDFWLHGNEHRCQSNNSLVFYSKPSKGKLTEIFKMMEDAGGSEPGFVNGEAALKRAPWFSGLNPCAEILLGNKSFCNLSEVDIGKFKGDTSGLIAAMTLTARANYRQTLVNLKDGVLQESWHLNNEFLRLCGVGLTGIARRPDLSSYAYAELQRVATSAAYSMANELNLQSPKNICTVKPSGTLSKIMDTTEGVHRPLGRYILNNVNFSKHDPVLTKLKSAGYKVIPSPIDPESTLVTFPVSWDDLEFTTKMSSVGEVQVNDESALDQLERYKMLQVNWTQQNTSVTISYDLNEVPGIINWLLANWDNYVGVSFIYRTDPSKSAKDLGYLYLPQEVTTKAIFDNYVAGLSEVFLDDDDNTFLELTSEECAGGVCPVK